MCGIAGMVGIEPDYTAEAADVHQMCETIVHRGPDDEGIYAHGRAGLGMRRLSTIDLSTGHQPIHNEEKDHWVVFNGEIYNFPELRLELEARGHRFYTNSDTEVIVQLYEEYGVECVKKLRGIFALAPGTENTSPSTATWLPSMPSGCNDRWFLWDATNSSAFYYTTGTP